MADIGYPPLTTADIDKIADRVVEKLTEANVVRFNKLRPPLAADDKPYVNSAPTQADTEAYLRGEG